MNREEDSQEKNDPLDSSKQTEGNSPVPVSWTHEGNVPTELVTSDHDEESLKTTEEAAVEKEAAVEEEARKESAVEEETAGEEAVGKEEVAGEAAAVEEAAGEGGLENISTGVTMDEVKEQPVPHEDCVVLENIKNEEDGLPRLQLESLESKNTNPTEVEEKEEEEEEEEVKEEVKEEDEGDEAPATSAHSEAMLDEDHLRLLQDLCEERDRMNRRSSQLQVKLAEYLRRKAGEGGQLQVTEQVEEDHQQQEYDKFISTLSEMEQLLSADSASAQLQAEELRLQSTEKLDQVETEWRALVAQKQDVAVAVLSRLLGKQAAQARVESAVAAEQLQQDQLTALRLKHIKLSSRIHRLETELKDWEEHGRDPLQIQFEQLQAKRMEQRKQAEKQHEEALKVQKKISSSLELLSNIKEKLCLSHSEVKAKREQLVELEAEVSRKRELLTRTKRARNNLQRDNLRLKERRGLLGNTVLLRDFEDTVDASDQLEEHLDNLKTVLSGGRRRRRRVEGPQLAEE